MQSKISELQSDLDALGKTLDEKEKQLATLREENRKLKTQVDDANIKVHISLPIFVHKKKLIWIFNTQLHYDSSVVLYVNGNIKARVKEFLVRVPVRKK